MDTDVLGAVQADEGDTEFTGVPGSTLSLASEKAHVVTAVGPLPEHEDDTTHTGRYQAVALNADPLVGAVN